MSEQKEKTAAFVEKVLGYLGIRASLEWKNSGDQDVLDIRGEDVGPLLANGAKVLYAIEYLANLIHGQEEARLALDCNDFRALRSYELELLARKAAEKVKETQRPFPLQPMPPNERRLVHMALVQDPTVRTESQGFGENRRVIIMPGK
jgi:spoIIIJ-associated protein